jgi:hypothetical protein
MIVIKTADKFKNATEKICRTTYVICWLTLLAFLFSVTARGSGDLSFFMMSISLLLFPVVLSLHLLTLLTLISLRTILLSAKRENILRTWRSVLPHLNIYRIQLLHFTQLGKHRRKNLFLNTIKQNK